MKRFLKIAAIIFLSIIACIILASWIFLQTTIYHPSGSDEMPVHTLASATPKQPDGVLKVMSYNIQYLAGKDYVFFYDLPDFAGPDTRPSSEAIARTLEQVVKVIKEQDADVVLLQEMDEGSSRTDNRNQTQLILSRLQDRYGYYAETFYWRALYVPHPKINGSVGMKLTTLSKYPIRSATRYQLPRIKENYIVSRFNFYRAILETRIEVGDKEIEVLNTHFDAFAHSSETMQRQVECAMGVLESLDKQSTPWIIGGDFNLLPPGFRNTMDPEKGKSFSETTELTPMFEHYRSIPSLEAIAGDDPKQWYTHFPNDPEVTAPDRIIDYQFYSKQLKVRSAKVLQGYTWNISDHLPIISIYESDQENSL